MAKILITGASGFIGANLLHRLVEGNNDVHIWIRSKSNLWRMKNIMKNYKKHIIDVTNAKLLKINIDIIKPEIIFHCATYGVSHLQKDPRHMFRTNILGSLNLFTATVGKSYIRHIINVGTSLEYGHKRGIITERTSERPDTLYGMTKLSQTQLASYFTKNFDLPVTTLRVFTSYGAFEEPKHLIGDIMLGIITKKPIKISTYFARRDFVYIDDVVDALIKAGHSEPFRDIINIGSGKEYSVKNIIEIAKQFGKIIVESDQPKNERSGGGYANTDKSKELLNWSAMHTIEDGLKKTYEWFSSNKNYYL